MTDKTDEQLQKEREAIAAMHNAKSNMEKALARIQTLENALRKLGDLATEAHKHLPSTSYMYQSNRCVKDEFVERAAIILRAL